MLINDLNASCMMHKFVDDTTLSEFIARGEASRINEYVNEVVTWSSNNQMNINYNKTKQMILGPLGKDCQNSLNIDGNDIQRLQVFKLLGVLIDDRLNWKCHVNAMCAKAASRLYFLRLLKRSGVLESDLLYFYISVIRSVLEYACPVWHNSLTAEQTHSIESIQKRAIYIIYGNDDYNAKCAALELPTLRCRRDLLSRNFFKTILIKDSCLNYLLPDPRNYDIINKLRTVHQFDPVTARTLRFQRSFVNFALMNYQ